MALFRKRNRKWYPVEKQVRVGYRKLKRKLAEAREKARVRKLRRAQKSRIETSKKRRAAERKRFLQGKPPLPRKKRKQR